MASESNPDDPTLFDLEDNEVTRMAIHVLAKLFCKKEEAAGQFRVSVSTFRDFLHRHPHMARAWTDGEAQAKVSLRSNQFQLSKKSVPMAIFLGKNYLGQRDWFPDAPPPDRPEGLPRDVDASRLTPDELREMERIIAKAQGDGIDGPANGASSAGTGHKKPQGLH